MKKNLENGKTNLLANSFATYAKTLLVLLCLQFTCVSASAANPFKLKATVNNDIKQITVEYENTNNSKATIYLHKLGDHYMNGNNAYVWDSKVVYGRSGKAYFSSANLASDAYVVRISGSGYNWTSSYFVVDNTAPQFNIVDHPLDKNATITFDAASGNVLKVIKKSSNEEVYSSSYSPCIFNYSNLAGGDYKIAIYKNNSVKSQKTFAVNKITSLKREGNYVNVGYEKGTSSNGGYTVMRITAVTSGKTYNEVPPCTDPESTGIVKIPVSDYYFKSDYYVISFLVDGVICDTQKTYLYFK